MSLVQRLVLVSFATGCATGPTGAQELANATFDGWETPEVVRADAGTATAARAVAVDEAPVRSLLNPTAPSMAGGIDAAAALAATAPAAVPTGPRTRRQAGPASAPKTALSKGGAVQLASRGRSGPAGTASFALGGGTVKRGLSSTQIKEVALASMGQVRACYERALKTDPSLRGKIVVDWTVASSGSVRSAVVKSDSLGNRKLQRCVVDTVRNWTFPSAGRSTDVTFPFTLRPG